MRLKTKTENAFLLWMEGRLKAEVVKNINCVVAMCMLQENLGK